MTIFLYEKEMVSDDVNYIYSLCNLQHNKHEFCCIQVNSLYKDLMEILQGMVCQNALSLV